jgi:hypothetical protein
MFQTRNILLDSTKLKPLTNMIDIPTFEISKILNPSIQRCVTPTSPKKTVSFAKLKPIDIYKEKIAKLGIFKYLKKDDLINNFDTGYFSFVFWTCIQTKTLGTFLVVKTPDNKIHFVSMRTKLIGYNYQYDRTKKCIYTNGYNKNDFISLDCNSFYEFPDEVIVLTPDDAYGIPNILSKM